MVQAADQAVAELVIDINDKQSVLDAILHLQNIYTDLIVHKDTRALNIANTRFCSTTVNSIVSDIDIYSDNNIISARLYTTKDGYKIYSNPLSFSIAHHNNNGFGWIPISGWDIEMIGVGINNTLVNKVRRELESHPPIMYMTT